MRLSSYNPQDRYKRKANERLAAFLVVLGVLALAFMIGFWLGKQAAGHQNVYLKKQVAELNAEQQELQETLTTLRAESQTAVARYEQLQETYQEILPEGPMQELVALLKQQLDEGRDPSRLAFLIRSARPPRNCTEPETKRFVVSTPAYQGPDSTISIADGDLIITGNGESAVNAEGKPEAWYDPSKKVSIGFQPRGGTKEVKSGIMPIKYSVVVGAREYRLNVTEGARSFAKVAFDSCDYP